MGKRKGVLFVSDLHAGSIYGMLPPDFQASDDVIINQNPGQKYLWECWDHMCKSVEPLGLHAVVVNGDAIDGKQFKQHASELCLTKIPDQALAAEETLLYLKKHTGTAKWYFIKGTSYHDGEAGESMESVAKALNATRFSGRGTGIYCRECLEMDIDGVAIDIMHEVPGGNGLSRGNGISREGMFTALGTREKVDAIVRSHLHYFYREELKKRHNIIVPCWQLQTYFMRRKSMHKMVPDIGGVIVWVDGEAKKRGEDAIEVRKLIYDLPKIVRTKV